MEKKSIIKRSLVGTLTAGTFAYAATFGLMVGFNQADAGYRKVPSSECHAAYDDNGSSVNNSGVLTYTSTGTKAIYCPMISDQSLGMSNSVTLNVYGNEGTNGATSRTCMCLLNPISCSCSSPTSWTNNSGGISGRVAANVDTQSWVGAPEQKFGYVLHYLSQNSSLAGMEMSSP